MRLINNQKIVEYVEARRLADGGYFFARIEPSSGLETCLAVKTLNLLGAEVKKACPVLDFWKKQQEKGNLDNLLAVYLMVETYQELGVPLGFMKKTVCRILEHTKETLILHPTINRIPPEKVAVVADAMNSISVIGRDLEDLYYWVRLAHALHLPLDKNAIANHVRSLRNADGGFGCKKASDPMLTFHALGILRTISCPIDSQKKLAAYVNSQLEHLDYLERLFFVVKSIELLNERLGDVTGIIEFIEGCYRNNGGFGRARSMGIATIEYTFMATSVLKYCEKSSSVC